MSEGNRFINGGSGYLDKLANHTIFVLISRVVMVIGVPIAAWLGGEVYGAIKTLNIQQVSTDKKLELLANSVEINARNESRMDAIREQRFEDWLKLRDQRLDRLERERMRDRHQP